MSIHLLLANHTSQDAMAQDRQIASLDPLNFDHSLDIIPAFNKAKNVNSLGELLYKHLPRPNVINRYSYEEALAAMRDIGILLGSIKRHKVEPVALVPELDYVQDILSALTDLPPRDTLLHYTIWNPEGKRLRTYTGTEDERALITSVQMAMHPLVTGIYKLIGLYEQSFYDKNFGIICKEVNTAFKAMVDGVVFAKKHVSPAFFANELRLYFDPIQLYKQTYLGPGAVEMPVFVFDHILWSSNIADEVYVKFKTTYLPYILPELRDIYYNYDTKVPLVSKMTEALEKGKINDQLLKNAAELMRLCQTLKSFRMPHKKLAEKAYAADNSPTRGTGSGGYSTDILSHIIAINNATIQRLADGIQHHKKLQIS